MIPNFDDLQAMSDQQLIDNYNQHAPSTIVGTGFYLEELRGRRMERMTSNMIEASNVMRTLTWFIAGMTFVMMTFTVVLAIK